MFSPSANSSTATLTNPPQKAQQPQPKNYEAAFGSLSSTYGFGTGSPYAPSSSPSSSKTASSSVSKDHAKSTPPSVPTTTGVSSTSSHGGAAIPPTQRPQKDYEAALAALSSSYGFGNISSPRSQDSSEEELRKIRGS
ncbi:hypothetical protein H0H93_012002 [Arthromyces matolae]|nr:hypothetical protein H0H93_012002 [Arthromyces matolae]